jgi:hypothetical protein
MKEIRFSEHSQLKIKILADRGITIEPEFIIETVRSPDKLEPGEEGKQIAQRRLDENRVLRVVYRAFNAFILIVTLYPGRKSRYEKD